MTSAAHLPEMGKKAVDTDHYDLLCECMSQIESLVVLDSATDEESNYSPPVSKDIEQLMDKLTDCGLIPPSPSPETQLELI